ncbi:uncharacterized protein LOC123715247 [Pieris brassicae]|uniref:uncharacterized protein LOC123715247 n=1 Tax=Pieris brassicae TaxID=7116 RepID=UPI001E65FC5E|nr:uncharacterized protein LOC123715247 [Pieris brassicae]
MDFDLTKETIPDIPGINLSNYVRDPYSYNPVVYIHKKLVPYANTIENPTLTTTSDKCLQFNHEEHESIFRTKLVNPNKDPLVEQTIKFAKDLIPLTIPPSTDAFPDPLYLIKTKKCQKRKKTECNCEKETNATYQKTKDVTDLSKSRNLCSGRESLSRSSNNNTLDDIQENRSLNCSSSDLSEKRNVKREKFLHKCKQNDVQMIASESFEALAENLNSTGDAKIKIHLMNEKDKSLLCESIKTPVIKAIRECIQEIHNTDATNFGWQNMIENTSQKVEIILEKLEKIEKKLESFYDRTKIPKMSKLEELEQDVITRDSTSEEELVQIHLARKTKSKLVRTLSPNQEETEDGSSRKMDRGELPSCFQSSSQLNIRPENPSRLPARFCWTDIGK